MSFPPPDRLPPQLQPSRAGQLVQQKPEVGRSGPPAAIYVPLHDSERLASGKRRALRVRIALGLVTGLLVVAGGVTAKLRAYYLPSSYLPPGLRIDGQRVPNGAGEAGVRALIDARGASLSAREIDLAMPATASPMLHSTFGEVGVRVDVGATLSVAAEAARATDLWARVALTRSARAGDINIPLQIRVDRDVGIPKLESLREATDAEPVSARLDLDKHATIHEKDGQRLDVGATFAGLEALALREVLPGAASRVARLDVTLVKLPPHVSSAGLKDLDISTVVAEYETFFSRGGDQKRRGKNIDNAAQKLDGLVIASGETVSFNAVVGDRSESNGFQKSWEIFKGEMVEGVGGGTCQVASTFHAVAFFGGFDVLERLPHSRPSAYIPMGLDSTVVYPSVDLRVRNPHSFPVVVHAKTEGGKLRVELLGKAHVVDVSFGRELVSMVPYTRKVVEEPTLVGRKVLVKQHGIRGFRVKRSRLLKYADGTQRKEDATDVYPPTTEIYNVPVGFDVAQLPALPMGDGEAADVPAVAPTLSLAVAPGAPIRPTPASTVTACAECSAVADGLEFVDGPGAHAPTSSQRDPAKTLWLKR